MLQTVEILQVDTQGSRELFKDCSPPDKAECVAILRDLFQVACQGHGGAVRAWNGDGGHAFFSTANCEPGSAVHAAKDFLKGLPLANVQSAVVLNTNSFDRQMRIAVHCGMVDVADSPGTDSAFPRNFDDFLKHEKSFAPKANEIFTTEEAYSNLRAIEKDRFEKYAPNLKVDSIDTTLYRLKTNPAAMAAAPDIIASDEPPELSVAEWNYIRKHIRRTTAKGVARNMITTGLIKSLDGPIHSIRPDSLLRLTLSTLYAWLTSIMSDNERYKFRISYWQSQYNGHRLKMVEHRFPNGEWPSVEGRCVNVGDDHFKVCQSFAQLEVVATPSVVAERHAGNWVDFDGAQDVSERDIASALQLPVYYFNRDGEKSGLGVLSLDSDKPDMFLVKEREFWREDLVGMLANLALAERLRICHG